jgi:uncharacterized membrane protein
LHKTTYLRNSLFNITFALNCLLLFFLIFETRIDVPVWLQVAGRMHPVFLHFPLVLVLGYAVTSIAFAFNKGVEGPYKYLASFLLLLAAFSSVLTALAGLLLSREAGYDRDALQWHKWSGAMVSFITLGWYYFHRRIHAAKAVSALVSIFAIFLVIFAGHQGAGITHGQNFLLAPMLPEKTRPTVSAEEAIVFADMVKPILEEKCEGCHNRKKAKGELVMETEALLLKGGKDGKLWDSTAADFGLLLRRLHLPLEAKKHMPPQGKPQLSEQEIEIIAQWIRKGADFKLRVADIPPTDTLHQLAIEMFSTAEIAEYDFDEADPATIEKLNTVNRVVRPEALGSPALSVGFYNSRLFTPEKLKELGEVKQQVVTLDLAKMPVKDADVNLIAEFENLRRLNLSFTEITGAALAPLQKLKHLRSLSLSGTQVNAEELKQLQNFPDLKTVYAWNTKASLADIDKLQEQAKQIRFESGYRGDTVELKLTPPVLLNDQVFIDKAVPLKLKHYIQGASIRYTLDGSEPDSVHSPEFTGKEVIDSSVKLKAKAFKPGWISSDVLEATIYKSTYTPDSVYYLTRAEDNYQDADNKYLYNREQGERDFRFGNWVGYRNNRMECIMHFAAPVPVHSVTLSTLVDPGPYVMPAKFIEIWGGHDVKDLHFLGRLIPKQPEKYIAYSREGYECKFDTTEVRFIKIIVQPVDKLPKWHAAKGQKGWFLVDEVLVN